MERLTKRTPNGVVGKKPLKHMTPKDVQELLDELAKYEDIAEYWEKKESTSKRLELMRECAEGVE